MFSSDPNQSVFNSELSHSHKRRVELLTNILRLNACFFLLLIRLDHQLESLVLSSLLMVTRCGYFSRLFFYETAGALLRLFYSDLRVPPGVVTILPPLSFTLPRNPPA